MPRKFLIPLLAAAFLVGPAMLSNVLVPDTPPGFTTLSLSGSALAEDKLFNGTRSNTFRTGNGGGPTTPPGGPKADKTTTINASHSNSYRMGGGGGSVNGKRQLQLPTNGNPPNKF